jgi:hypothetical protein
MNMKHRWNDIGKGPEKNLPQSLFIHPKFHTDDPGLQLGIHGEKIAINSM